MAGFTGAAAAAGASALVLVTVFSSTMALPPHGWDCISCKGNSMLVGGSSSPDETCGRDSNALGAHPTACAF